MDYILGLINLSIGSLVLYTTLRSYHEAESRNWPHLLFLGAVGALAFHILNLGITEVFIK